MVTFVFALWATFQMNLNDVSNVFYIFSGILLKELIGILTGLSVLKTYHWVINVGWQILPQILRNEVKAIKNFTFVRIVNSRLTIYWN